MDRSIELKGLANDIDRKNSVTYAMLFPPKFVSQLTPLKSGTPQKLFRGSGKALESYRRTNFLTDRQSDNQIDRRKF